MTSTLNRRRALVILGCACATEISASIQHAFGQEVQRCDAISEINPTCLPLAGTLASKSGDINSLTAADISRSTGNHELDALFDRGLRRLSEAFSVRPGFGFYDDADGENAFATPRRIFGDADGTVVFGTRLFRSMLRKDPSGGSVMWTAAHEFAHIWAYKVGLIPRINMGQKTVKLCELHADFMAGAYLGDRKSNSPFIRLWRSGEDIWNSGDTLYNNPSHHGTPNERLKSAEAGFNLVYNEKKSFAEAFTAGEKFVKSLD